MLKLIKYEFIKKSKLFLILACIAVIANLILGLAYGTEGVALFLVLFPLVLIIVYTYELIKSYSDDLNKTTGYMIFLTPNSGYTIIGAKLIFTLLTALIFILTYVIFLTANLSIIVLVNYSASEFTETYNTIINNMNNFSENTIGFNIGDLLLIFLMILSSMIVFTLTVYSSITLRKSIFSNIKFGGLISFIIFIILNILIGKGNNLVTNTLETSRLINQMSQNSAITYPSSYMVKLISLTSLYNLVVCILLMLGSGYLLERKINL